ncbi:hypothetical protein WMY93_006264 [Mugilogobius chulae]|uniref:Uncharacterized protein n=1 Tax=Mugilogobius chulae TaxID=88201 RepID=A0AAW0PTJ0_9GOBI
MQQAQTGVAQREYSPNEVRAVAAESRLLEEPRSEFVIFYHMNVLLPQSTFPSKLFSFSELELDGSLGLTSVMSPVMHEDVRVFDGVQSGSLISSCRCRGRVSPVTAL